MSSTPANDSNAKNSEFGIRLKEAFNNSSNQSIAEKLGVSNPALTAYIQGRIPPPDKLIEIAKLTGCSLNWLLTGDAGKASLSEIKRPQGIIIQGSKGGIGTSTSAVLIASIFALKGYGVLLADDVLHTCSSILFPHQTSSGSSLKPDKPHFKNFLDDIYLPTRHKNLDFFVPRGQEYSNLPVEKHQKFNFDYSELQKRYQFVIFDVQRAQNPFYYYNSTSQDFRLEPILRNAKVIVPFDLQQSIINNVVITKKYIDKQKEIYPAADFLGLFLIESTCLYKSHMKFIKETLEELQLLFGSKIYKTKIARHNLLRDSYEKTEKILFSRKTKIFHNYSQLVDEIINKLSANF